MNLNATVITKHKLSGEYIEPVGKNEFDDCIGDLNDLNTSSKNNLVAAINEAAQSGSGGSGTSNYNNLSNKPKINGVTLSGSKTASAIGLATQDHTHSYSSLSDIPTVADETRVDLIELSKSGYSHINTFVVGSGSAIDGTPFLTHVAYRVYTESKFVADGSVSFVVSNGFRAYVWLVDDTGECTSKGWKTGSFSYDVTNGAFFCIARETDDTSETADVLEFRTKLKYKSALQNEIDAIKDNVCDIQDDIGSLSDLITVNKNNLVAAINEASSSGSGSSETNYNLLENKPQIGGITLAGNKTAGSLGLSESGHTHSYSAISGKPSIEGHELNEGDHSAVTLGLAPWSHLHAYSYLQNLPKIEGVTISENNTAKSLGLAKYDHVHSYYELANLPDIPDVTKEYVDSSDEDILNLIGDVDSLTTASRNSIVDAINEVASYRSGSGSGTEYYNLLTNKPKINGVTLIGDKTSSELGVANAVHTHTSSQINDLDNYVDGRIDNVVKIFTYDTTYDEIKEWYNSDHKNVACMLHEGFAYFFEEYSQTSKLFKFSRRSYNYLYTIVVDDDAMNRKTIFSMQIPTIWDVPSVDVDKSYVDDANSTLQSHIGNIDNLNTAATTSVVDAINEVVLNHNNLESEVSQLGYFKTIYDDSEADTLAENINKKCKLVRDAFSGSYGCCIVYGGWSGVNFGIFTGQSIGSNVVGMYMIGAELYHCIMRSGSDTATYTKISA